jgi:hypothetical protein
MTFVVLDRPAATFEQARGAFEAAWPDYFAHCTEANLPRTAPAARSATAALGLSLSTGQIEQAHMETALPPDAAARRGRQQAARNIGEREPSTQDGGVRVTLPFRSAKSINTSACRRSSPAIVAG